MRALQTFVLSARCATFAGMDHSSEEGPEAQLGTVGRHKDAVERPADDCLNRDVKPSRDEIRMATFERESELERDAYIDEATRRATSEHNQRVATYKMDRDYAGTLRIQATIRRESERERAGWYERKYFKSRLVEIYREVAVARPVDDDAPNFSGNGVEVHELDDRGIMPLYNEPGFEEWIFGERAVIGAHLTKDDRHAVYPLKGYVAIVPKGASRAEKLEHFYWLSDGDVLEGAVDTFSSGEGGPSRTLMRMRYERREAQASSAVEAEEAGEEDKDGEDEGEEEELDFAEQDAERAFGHEMRPFGVPNPNPYRPAKRGRSWS